jgi:hypothetical protein
MRITMDRREWELLPITVQDALTSLEEAIMQSEWSGVQVIMTRRDEGCVTTVDVEMHEEH